jgi:hypothetical protein
LIDALSALLRIAAEASRKRKEKALQVLFTSKDPSDQRRLTMIKRKLRLVPTCWWEAPPSEIRLTHPDMPKDDMCCLPIVVTYTNIEDLRSYVQSNIRAFTKSGGCALFLEAIARIHGSGSLMHMIRQSRSAAGHTGSDALRPLLCCTCTKRHLKSLDEDPILQKTLKAEMKKGTHYDATPRDHSCFSTELLSLLLVGRVHSTLQGWSTAPLGLGVLSNNCNEVGRSLTRPEKPIWILRGPTCYSVTWMNGCNEHADTFAHQDHSGAVASMTHWNCWYNVRNATGFRLATDRFSIPPSDTNTLVAKEFSSIEMIDTTGTLFASDVAVQQIVVHPDDPIFYPNLYRMWRYDMVGESISNVEMTDADATTVADRKKHVPVWKSYNRLNDHEKCIVETKMGPKICTVLWTRWPRAVVDRYTPNDILPDV